MDFDQTAASEICERIARGESLRKICGAERDDFLPGQTSVYQWLATNEDFAKQYARARELQADSKFDEADDIAKSATVENVQLARLQIDTIKWQASKLSPKKYGDSVQMKHTGEDGGPVKVQAIEWTVVDPPTPGA